MDLAEALGLGDRELVSFVGAGGKKSAMARLVDAGRTRDCDVGYTTTTHVPPPDLPLVLGGSTTDDLKTAEAKPRSESVSSAVDALDAALTGTSPPIAFARERVANPDRVDEKLRGYAPPIIDAVFATRRFDWLLVKADGARQRELKAPDETEPQVPSRTTLLAPVASIQAVGTPLTSETVHRTARVASITGRRPGEHLTASDIGAVLASPDGGRKDAPAGATIVPIVNKADSPPLQESAREAIAYAVTAADELDRGLVTSFQRDICEVITATDIDDGVEEPK